MFLPFSVRHFNTFLFFVERSWRCSCEWINKHDGNPCCLTWQAFSRQASYTSLSQDSVEWMLIVSSIGTLVNSDTTSNDTIWYPGHHLISHVFLPFSVRRFNTFLFFVERSWRCSCEWINKHDGNPCCLTWQAFSRQASYTSLSQDSVEWMLIVSSIGTLVNSDTTSNDTIWYPGGIFCFFGVFINDLLLLIVYCDWPGGFNIWAKYFTSSQLANLLQFHCL